jgi:peptide/nickel transport system substrate-binding protein
VTDERHAEPNQTAPGAKRASELSRRRLLQASAAVGAATAAGAGGFLLGNRAVETGAAAPALAPSRQGANVLVAGWEEDAATLDPAKTICGHEVRIVNQFGNTLWGLEDTATEPVPMLAESWESSEDGLTWTVTIKPDLMFQDGTPCDAEAVKWSFDRFLVADHPFYDPPYNLLSYYLGGPDLDYGIANVEVVDPTTVVFTLKKASANFESDMMNGYAAVISPTAMEEAGLVAFGEKPVSTGPFMVSSWEKGVRIVMDRFDGFYGEPAGVDQLIIRPIVENAARFAALQQGEVDFISAMGPEFIPLVEQDPNLQLMQAPGFHIWWIALNVHEEPMANVQVRQALNYAINKQVIVDTILQGAATLSNGPIIAHSWANDPAVEPYPYDPEMATSLLAEAGYADGFTTSFWVPESGSGMIAPTEIAQVVQADLAAVGVTAEIVTQEWTSYVADWQNNGLDAGTGYGMAEMSWNFSSPDPAQWLDPNVRTDAHPPGGGFNGSFYSNPEVDDLLTQASASFSLEERTELFKQAQVIMREDCPWIFMFSANNIAAATARLKGIELNSDPSVVSLYRAYFED